ncbi:MAG: 4-hydroxythreonine-4-phosphate dehydrogenase PdxA [Hellea sp.]|nr:4-hydroxythreonine-4-phosphate dehydrogenase PdxA [Hellea sp.]
MNAFRPLILTLGDPAGVGPEITVKAWSALRDNPKLSFTLVGPYDLMARKLNEMGQPAPRIIETPEMARSMFGTALPLLPMKLNQDVEDGRPTPVNGTVVTGSIERAVKHCLAGEAEGIVTNPISKDILYQANFKYPGHTEYLGMLTQDHQAPYAHGPLMMLANSELRVALVTVHQSVEQAALSVTEDKIIRHARILHGALIHDLGIDNPRIALAALNPHAGENGAMGDTEITIINPAAAKLRAEGIDISDAMPPDTMFHKEARAKYDAALCMYHDQGLIPVKTIDFHGTVNVTMGLPIVRTSPDHGTAFDIAGQNIARPDSLIAAIKLARQIADTRNG